MRCIGMNTQKGHLFILWLFCVFFCCVKEDNKYEILRVLRKGIK